eukprot:TRINITY_DN11712_c0_g2_i1.p1 TRINITY_DN11712_c0_g2~~TRINITY_DN11712_c0_g2_i1.p1  ORF type:complete len:523 (+),score=79.41 TRINITY_DN11712_c0_g2_i1:304-1872(+)
MEFKLNEAEVSKGSFFETNNLARLVNCISEMIEVQQAFRQETQARWCELDQRGQELLEEIARIKGDVSACVDVADEDCVAFRDVDANARLPNSSDARASTTKIFNPHIDHWQIHKRTQSRESPTSRSTLHIKMNKIVRSPLFQALMNCCICINIVVMAAELEYSGRILERGSAECVETFCDEPNNVATKFFGLARHVFCAIYVAEMTILLLVHGCSFFFVAFNCIDFVVVLVSMMEIWVFPLMKVTSFLDASVLRMIRFGKMAKTTRMVGLLQSCKALRVLLKALASSIGACVWSFVLIGIIVLMGACLFSQLAHNEIPNMPPESMQRILLLTRFGKCSTSIMSTLEMTLVGGAYTKYEKVGAVFPAFWAAIVVYRLVVSFAGMKVIGGLFLKTTMSAAAREVVDSAHNSLLAITDVRSLDGVLTEETLQELLTDPLVRKLFKDLNITESHVFRLFKAHHPCAEVRAKDFMNEAIEMSLGTSTTSSIVMCRQIQSLFSSELSKMQNEKAADVGDSSVRVQSL